MLKKNLAIFLHMLKPLSISITYYGKFRPSLRQKKWEKGIKVVLDKQSIIKIGSDNSFRSWLQLRALNGGSIKIGNSNFCNTNVSITSMESITIGDHVKIANNVVIIDHDHDYVNNNIGYQTAPISIADHVWIGANSVILKGVSIGSHSVVAAGAVVKENIPEYCIVGGVPAKILKLFSCKSEREEE